MVKIFYVYILFRPDSGQPFYVGKGKDKRIGSHTAPTRLRSRKRPSHKDLLIEKIIREGKDIPRVKIAQGLFEAEAFELEKLWIATLGRYPNGPLLNATDGGEGTAGSSPEQQQAWRISMSKYWNSPEWLAKQSEKIKKRKITEEQRIAHSLATSAGKLGKGRADPLPAEWRKNISLGNKGKPKSKAHRKALSEAAKGKIISEEQKEAIRKKLSGVKFSEERKASLRESRAKRRAERLENSVVQEI